MSFSIAETMSLSDIESGNSTLPTPEISTVLGISEQV